MGTKSGNPWMSAKDNWLYAAMNIQKTEKVNFGQIQSLEGFYDFYWKCNSKNYFILVLNDYLLNYSSRVSRILQLCERIKYSYILAV